MDTFNVDGSLPWRPGKWLEAAPGGLGKCRDSSWRSGTWDTGGGILEAGASEGGESFGLSEGQRKTEVLDIRRTVTMEILEVFKIKSLKFGAFEGDGKLKSGDLVDVRQLVAKV